MKNRNSNHIVDNLIEGATESALAFNLMKLILDNYSNQSPFITPILAIVASNLIMIATNRKLLKRFPRMNDCFYAKGIGAYLGIFGTYALGPAIKLSLPNAPAAVIANMISATGLAISGCCFFKTKLVKKEDNQKTNKYKLA